MEDDGYDDDFEPDFEPALEPARCFRSEILDPDFDELEYQVAA